MGDFHTQPDNEHDNWLLHRQPKDQIADHEFSIWSGEHPVVLANEYPGEDGILAFIVSELNAMDALKSQVEKLRKALVPFAADKMPSATRSEIAYDRYGLRRSISPLELARDDAFRALAMPLEQSGSGK